MEKKKWSINKDREKEVGGRDGNGKKDEVSLMGQACADLLNPFNLLHLLLFTSFLHHFSFQGEARRGEIKKEAGTWRSDISADIRWKRRSEVKQMIVCFRGKEQESMPLGFIEGKDLGDEDDLLCLLWPVLMGHVWALGRRALGNPYIRHKKNNIMQFLLRYTGVLHQYLSWE